LHPQQDLTLGEAHPAGRTDGVGVGGLNADVRAGQNRWHRKKDEHDDGWQDEDELPGDHRRDDQEEQHQQPKRRERPQCVREPCDHRFASSRVADDDAERYPDGQGGQ